MANTMLTLLQTSECYNAQCCRHDLFTQQALLSTNDVLSRQWAWPDEPRWTVIGLIGVIGEGHKDKSKVPPSWLSTGSR